MATYEEIQKANAAIKTTPIHGKDYAEVNERIKAFRKVFPEGTILTEMIHNENGMVIFRSRVLIGDIVLGEGTAYEKENSSTINKTSYIENCETSAVGRALGMAGFGIDTSIASAEEVAAVKEEPNSSERRPPLDEHKPLYQFSDEENAIRNAIYDELEDLDPGYVGRAIKAKGVHCFNDLSTKFWQKCLEKKREAKK